ncbi:MAG TPA: DUF397 domain-containing protein [Actinokineospora sp.]|nr:DUF397 domain-containing protein [Actinokineospora sp.]
MPTLERLDGWRKSSFSNTGNGCVEIARTLGGIRDSKNPDGPRLVIDVDALVRQVKAH